MISAFPGLLKMIKTRMTVNCSNILEISIWLGLSEEQNAINVMEK